MKEPDFTAAIATIESSRQSHVGWMEYFIAHPEQEEKYAETVDGAQTQREIIAAYDNVLNCLRCSQS